LYNLQGISYRYLRYYRQR